MTQSVPPSTTPSGVPHIRRAAHRPTRGPGPLAEAAGRPGPTAAGPVACRGRPGPPVRRGCRSPRSPRRPAPESGPPASRRTAGARSRSWSACTGTGADRPSTATPRGRPPHPEPQTDTPTPPPPPPQVMYQKGGGGSEERGEGVWLGPPLLPGSPYGPHRRLLKPKSSWHRRRRSKFLAVSLKHWKGRGGGGLGGLPALPAVYGRSWPPSTAELRHAPRPRQSRGGPGRKAPRCTVRGVTADVRTSCAPVTSPASQAPPMPRAGDC